MRSGLKTPHPDAWFRKELELFARDPTSLNFERLLKIFKVMDARLLGCEGTPCFACAFSMSVGNGLCHRLSNPFYDFEKEGAGVLPRTHLVVIEFLAEIGEGS